KEEESIRDISVTVVQTCVLPISHTHTHTHTHTQTHTYSGRVTGGCLRSWHISEIPPASAVWRHTHTHTNKHIHTTSERTLWFLKIIPGLVYISHIFNISNVITSNDNTTTFIFNMICATIGSPQRVHEAFVFVQFKQIQLLIPKTL